MSKVRTFHLKRKPIDIVRFHGLKIYSTEFQEHKGFYDFFNSENCVNDFLNISLSLVVKNGPSVRLQWKTFRILHIKM